MVKRLTLLDGRFLLFFDRIRKDFSKTEIVAQLGDNPLSSPLPLSRIIFLERHSKDEPIASSLSLLFIKRIN